VYDADALPEEEGTRSEDYAKLRAASFFLLSSFPTHRLTSFPAEKRAARVPSARFIGSLFEFLSRFIKNDVAAAAAAGDTYNCELSLRLSLSL